MSTTPDVYSKHKHFAEIAEVAVGPAHRNREGGAGVGVLFAVLDTVIIMSAGVLAYYFRNYLPFADPATTPAQDARARLFGFLVCYIVLTLICNAAQNLYSASILHSAQISRVKILKSLVLSSMITVMVVFLAGEQAVPLPVLGSTMFFGLAGLLVLRWTVQQYNLKRIERGIGTQHVLIVGAGPIGQAFQNYLESHRYLGKMFCGFVDDNRRSGPNWLGTPDDLPRLLVECFIDEIYFTPEASRDLVLDVALRARQDGISVKVVPDLYDGLALGAGVTYIGNVPVLQLNHQPIPAMGLFVKRVLDVLVGAVLLVVTAPVMLVTAIAIKLDSEGPVFYSAWRVGRKGHKFMCHKFRTMVADADARKNDLRHMNERCGATFKIAKDPRITRLGRLLRKYSLDELPQLFNVMKGEMSVVGPRPHPVDDYAHYQLADLRRLDVLPGITGLWQVSARRDPSFEKNVMLDLEYIQNWNVWMDLKILLKTVPEVFRGLGH